MSAALRQANESHHCQFFSEVARVWINALVDDDVDLPKETPSAECIQAFEEELLKTNGGLTLRNDK